MSLDDFKIELNYNITDESLDILKKHIIKSQDFLRASKLLLDNNELPHFYSRLYYSCYHIVNSLFYLYSLLVKSSVFTEIREISTHNVLINFFNRCFIKTEIFDKSFSTLFKDLKDFRMVADYHFDEFDKEKSIEYYNNGLNFVNTIKDKIDNGLKEIGK